MNVHYSNSISAISLLPELFVGIVFYKKEDHDDNSIYVAKVSRMSMSSHNNYIVLICEPSPKKKGFYKDFNVRSIQTRTLPSYYFSCPGIVWNPNREGYDIIIYAKRRQHDHTNYETPEGDLEILLFHDHRKKDLSGKIASYQYPTKYNLMGALETFRCVIHTKLSREKTFVLL